MSLVAVIAPITASHSAISRLAEAERSFPDAEERMLDFAASLS